jgi:AbrB family looped-hinge helix DNA binding protein
MSATSKAFPTQSVPAKTVTAKITSKGQITIPVEIRHLLGVQVGDNLVFEMTSDGVKISRQSDENVFEKYRGIGNGLPELDGGIDEIVRYMRESRGHDEIDDLILGTGR